MGKGDAAFLFFPRNVPRNAHAGLYLRDQSVLSKISPKHELLPHTNTHNVLD